MANQSTPKNRARIESEIERNREESNWDRCLDLAQQLGNDQPELINFLIGEAKLEKFLEGNKQSTVGSPSFLVEEAQEHLKQCLKGSNSSPLAMDANLLLAKSYYVIGNFETSLKHIELSGIDNINKIDATLPLRVMKLVAESLAVKGMSLEQIETNNNFEKRTTCLSKSSDLAIKYMQNVEKQQGSYMVASFGSILEMAIQRAPIVYIKAKQMDKACEQYRAILNACETPSTLNTRQILSRQFAEVILRGISRSAWTKFVLSSSPYTTKKLKPQRYIGQSLFVPKEREEEAVLLLMISEMLASRNVVLDRNPEFKRERDQSLRNVISVYDLMTIALTPFQYYMTEMFERSMKFSFDVKHVWFQFALTLLESKKSPFRAYLLLKEVLRIDKKDPLPCLIAAKVSIVELFLYEEGLELANEALKRCQDDVMMSKAHLMVGIANALLYENQTESVKKRKIYYLNDSIKHLQKAMSNSFDNLSYFHLGLHLAHQRALNDAVCNAKISLSLYPQHLPTLELLILCLSALKQYQEALFVCESALEEYPGHLILLYIKAHLEEVVLENGHEVALLTAKEMLNCWSVINSSEQKRTQYTTSNYFSSINYDSLSIKMEQTLGDAASLTSGTMRDGISSNLVSNYASNKSMWALHIHIWMMIIEMFIKLGQYDQAGACISELANDIFGPLSHQLMYIKGILCKARGQLNEAKTHLQNTISINPNHAKALQQLGHTYYLLENHDSAEKYLKDSLNIDATLHETWSYMGLIYHAINDDVRAVECQLTALQLESSAPILPFNIISRAVFE